MSATLPKISPRGEKMTAAEARAACEAIRSAVDTVRATALDLYKREGWVALGYNSWRECVVAEFAQSKSHLYRQLQAALIEAEISPRGEIGTIQEGRMRPLGALPEGERKPAWDAATEAAGGLPTGQQVREQVDQKLGRKPHKVVVEDKSPDFADEDFRQDWEDEPENLLADETGRSVVNGVEQDDPPEIADQRRRGTMPAGVVPIIETDDRVLILEPESRDPGEDDDSDPEDWLASLPLAKYLSGEPYKTFRADALAYRRFKPTREVFRPAVAEALKGLRHKGEFAQRLKRLMRAENPKYWHRCLPTSDGGCGGLGLIPGIGEACPVCYGRGYTLDQRSPR